ncbi:unnamed protein product [Closterium sp. NIES-64]|nr:unnamed protein product [Closterium sp. NIES-65]CAI5994223.1 unnamed protein product [Closterium sp. NIES-64]
MAVNGSRIVTISPCAPAAPPPPPAALPCAHLPSPRVSSIRFCREHLGSAGGAGGGRDCRNRSRSSRRRAAIVAGAAANRVGGQGGGESFEDRSNADERLSADRENADRGGAGGGNAERLEDLEAVDRLAQELAAAAGAAGAESETFDRRSAAHEAEKAEAEAEEQQGRRSARGEGDDAAAAWIGSSVAFAEEDEQGRKYLEVLVTSVHRVDHGMVVGVLCSPANRGPPVDACREFPLFLNDLIAAPCHDAMQRGGLPNALEGLERLSDMDLQRTLVHAISEDIGAVSFVLLDEKTGEFSRVDSSFPQAMALALRYRQPLRVERWCILASNRDFIERMLLNPIAREAENDASLLADLARRMRELEMRPQELKTQLDAVINAEEYERAAQLKAALVAEERVADARLFSLLAEVKRLYLDRLSVFFKL